MRPWPIGAARLFVGEDVLQRDDLLGHAHHARLRGVDDGEPLVELGEIFARRLGVGLEARADALADIVEPLRHDPRKIGLARAEPFAEAAEPPVEFRA